MRITKRNLSNQQTSNSLIPIRLICLVPATRRESCQHMFQPPISCRRGQLPLSMASQPTSPTQRIRQINRSNLSQLGKATIKQKMLYESTNIATNRPYYLQNFVMVQSYPMIQTQPKHWKLTKRRRLSFSQSQQQAKASGIPKLREVEPRQARCKASSPSLS